ncbi:MAG: GNAT family N-acetyltransferase [Anaerolineae bacterium]|nr:GNAT family N-acetyltransferase [Anaerolineae bacterium]
MIDTLDKNDYDRVSSLFQPFEGFQPFCTAVLAGIHPGWIFVDDLDRPHTAFLNHKDSWCYLAGDPANTAFNRALNEAIWQKEAIKADVPVLLLTCASDGWDAAMAAILSPREPIATRRRCYTCQQVRIDWRLGVPEEFTVRQIDESLLDLDLPGEVRDFVEKCRDTDSPDFQDYGFVAIDKAKKRVVSWATVDAIVCGVGDVGLHTLPDYRRRGLATATTGAALAHGLAHGLTAIVWTCAESNVPSFRTAEKLGLARKADYTLYYMAFDKAEHLSMQAYHELDAGRYWHAAELYERMIASGEQDQPSFIYYEAARAWAGAGDGAKALHYVTQAIAKGWTGLEELAQTPEFAGLIASPGWQAVLAQEQS